VDVEAADRAGISLTGQAGLQVVVVNGNQLTSPGCCRQLPISIHSERFLIDFYGLALGSYDMVLGVQWLESLSPILWDFGRRTLTFVHDGHRVVWCAPDAAAPLATLMAARDDLMDEQLSAFTPLFEDPTGLPPPRLHNHRIQLLPGTAPVAVRPYRYAYT
jgi:hypothetical protein